MQARIDKSGLKAGIAAAKKVSKRSAREIVNTSAYWIAVNAKNASPYVEALTIDRQLGVLVTPVIGKRGKPLKRKTFYEAGGSPLQRKTGVPFAALIIAARARPGSNYNRQTNSRFALSKNPFAGVSRAAGAEAMRKLVNKMVKGRHSSTKFLVAGWIPSIRIMRPHAVQKYMPGVSVGVSWRTSHGAELGSAAPATGDGVLAVASIENAIGTEGVMREKMNRALLVQLSGPLQTAVDREGVNQMNYALKKLGGELSDAVKPGWG
jgi:hypothetical protein